MPFSVDKVRNSFDKFQQDLLTDAKPMYHQKVVVAKQCMSSNTAFVVYRYYNYV